MPDAGPTLAIRRRPDSFDWSCGLIRLFPTAARIAALGYRTGYPHGWTGAAETPTFTGENGRIQGEMREVPSL